MEHIKVAKVPDVTVIRKGVATKGTLHLTTHHMIFRDSKTSREIWICYPIIGDVERRQFNANLGHSTIRIRCRDFSYLAMNFDSEQLSKDVFESIMKLTCVSHREKLYAFMYKPGSLEKKLNGWKVYDPVAEFERMGTFEKKKWRWTSLNTDYGFSPSYPSKFVVPESISDNVLNYGVKFRSRQRLPALSYYHKFNDCTITRCAQPMVGIKQNRSPQDEKLISAVFNTTVVPESIGARQENLIIDARPTANAMAQTAMGAGTEIMENYKNSKKVYLGIDNIHVMRESLNKVVDALKGGDLSPLPPNQELLYRSGWLKHITLLLEGSVLIARQIHYNFSHVLIHCSDGWDRTSQLSSIAQICLDPYFRTIDGFITLVEKDWLSFGFRFAERSGHLSNEKHFVQITDNNSNQATQVFNQVSHKLVKQSHVKYTSPVFHQFLDCVYQIIRQFPEKFEYNERFLRRLLYHSYSCQYGTFLYNCERERVEAKAASKTRSVWDYILARRKEFTNSSYDPSSNQESEIMLPNPKEVKWWNEVFGRSDQEMNSALNRIIPTIPVPPSPSYSSSSATTPLPESAKKEEVSLQYALSEGEMTSTTPTPSSPSMTTLTTSTTTGTGTPAFNLETDEDGSGDLEAAEQPTTPQKPEEEPHRAQELRNDLPSFLRRDGQQSSRASDLARNINFESLSLAETRGANSSSSSTSPSSKLFNKIAESTGFK